MRTETLKLIAENLADIGVNYEFGEWSSDIVKYPYWVGSYTESESMTEDGLQETTFTLDGFSKNSWLEIQRDKEKIEKLFSNLTAITESGSGVAVLYANAMNIPTGDSAFKRIQINLSVKEWSVDI